MKKVDMLFSRFQNEIAARFFLALMAVSLVVLVIINLIH